MKPEIKREYFPNGTTGKLTVDGKLLCYTIELPWDNNTHRTSCIPEGKYLLKKRYSLKFGKHLLVTGVKDRSLILIHPANNAIKELKGCIAPVSFITGPGTGTQSRAALKKFIDLCYASLDKGEEVWLVIKGNNISSSKNN